MNVSNASSYLSSSNQENRYSSTSLNKDSKYTSGGDENREYDESWTRTVGKLSKDRYSHYLQSTSTVENNFRLSYEKDKKSSEDVPQKLSWRKQADKLKALTGLSSAKERTQNALSESSTSESLPIINDEDCSTSAKLDNIDTTTNTMGSSKHTLQRTKTMESVGQHVEQGELTVHEIHFIGELTGAFAGNSKSALSCQFRVECGNQWSVVDGETNGQTQYCYCYPSHSGTSRSHLLNCCWNHPVDLHYFLGWNSSDTTENNYNCGANSMLQGWPRMVLQVWELDCYNRILPVGYGFLHLPATSGTYDLTVPCWRPKGTYMEEIKAFFLGPTPQLADDTCIFGRAWEDRCKLVTIPCLQVSALGIRENHVLL
jgi:B9 domain-containing protein 2